MTSRVVVLGAGFGGLELTTMLSEALGPDGDVTLIDRSDHFIFGYSKLDVMFGVETPDAVRLPYREFVKPGVRLLQETITAIDPVARRVTTDGGVHEADVLVVALGADYDMDATPGLAEGGNEFYSAEGAERLREVLPGFSGGHAVIGVCGAPFKCPPAPSECALLLHEHLTERGIRGDCEITLVMPFGTPVPPSPDTSAALHRRLRRARHPLRARPPRERRSTRRAASPCSTTAARCPSTCSSASRGTALPTWCWRAGWPRTATCPSTPRTLDTRFPGVYALGDVATQGTPKAGVFAEGAARAVATSLIAEMRGGGDRQAHTGTGSCYVEFGAGRIGRVDVDFFSGPSPTGTFQEPSVALRADKQHFGSSRRARWFGRSR